MKIKSFVRNIMTAAAVVIAAQTVCAQTLQLQEMRSGAPVRDLTRAAAGSIRWGYCDENIDMGIGNDQIGLKFTAAIYVPAGRLGAYASAGNRITGVHVGFWEAATDCRIFIMAEDGGLDDLLYEQTVGDVQEGWQDIMFDTPVDIPETGFYVGYEVVSASGTQGYPIGLSGKFDENGCWLYDELPDGGGEFSNYAVSQEWNALCLQLIIEGEIPENPLMCEVMVDDGVIQAGEAFTLQGRVTNLGEDAIESFEMSAEADGQVLATKTVDGALRAGQSKLFSIDVPGISAGDPVIDLVITKVNGTDYPLDVRASTMVICYETLYDRTVVVEEGTGTWCGYCPRGIVGMEYMKGRYPDSYIGIAVHCSYSIYQSDPMEVAEYLGLAYKYFSGYPSCIVNRMADWVIDPNSTDLEAAYRVVHAEGSLGHVEVSAGFNEAGTAIEVSTQSTFGYTAQHADYNVAIVLLENDVTGYKQTNYFAGNAEQMGGWESMPRTVEWAYDEVARGIYGTWEGTEGSVPATFTMGEPVVYNCEITAQQLADARIQDKDQLEVVALLIDNRTGEIVNADKVAVDYNGSAETIASDYLHIFAEGGRIAVEGEFTSVEVYNLQGVRVVNEQLPAGVYVVRVETPSGCVVRKAGI